MIVGGRKDNIALINDLAVGMKQRLAINVIGNGARNINLTLPVNYAQSICAQDDATAANEQNCKNKAECGHTMRLSRV